MKESHKYIHVELIDWFNQHKRDLPWRKRRTPYRVWVSELMLQQTRVDQAIQYYNRFMRQFPSLRALSRAQRDDVLKAWEGLGYYGRARRMHETAQYLVKENAGRFPDSYSGLLNLKGIGPYTAAAIGSLSLELNVALVDGNVARVLSRMYAYSESVDKASGKNQLLRWAEDLLPEKNAGVFNEAMMELGATCCLPRKPLCSSCPIREKCLGYKSGAPEKYPKKKLKKKLPIKEVGAGIVLNRKKEFLISQRNDDGMLGGLWEFPGGTREKGESIKACIARELYEELGITSDIGSVLIIVKHTYSHFKMTLHAHWAKIRSGRPRAKECANYKWVKLEDLGQYPFSKADLYIIEELKKHSRYDSN